MTGRKKTNFELGVWSARQDLAKELLAICQLNDAQQTQQKISHLASRILNTETVDQPGTTESAAKSPQQALEKKAAALRAAGWIVVPLKLKDELPRDVLAHLTVLDLEEQLEER